MMTSPRPESYENNFSVFSVCSVGSIFTVEKKPGRLCALRFYAFRAFIKLSRYKIVYMSRPLIGGAVRGFVVEGGVVGQGGVGDVVYGNDKRTGGFDFVGHKSHGASGAGNT